MKVEFYHVSIFLCIDFKHLSNATTIARHKHLAKTPIKNQLIVAPMYDIVAPMYDQPVIMAIPAGQS